MITLDPTPKDEAHFKTLDWREQDKILKEMQRFLFGETREDRYRVYCQMFKLITKYRQLKGLRVGDIVDTTPAPFEVLGALLAVRSNLDELAEIAEKHRS